jgi:hypothetical protein
MIQNGVFRLTKDSIVMDGMDFKAGQEFEVIAGVVYMGGFPLQLNLQALIKDWMSKNMPILVNDTRNF